MSSNASPERSYLRQVVTMLGGTTTAQIILVAAAPALGRLYTPEHFGDFALFAGVLAVLLILADGRYELALVLCADDEVSALRNGIRRLALAVSTLVLLVAVSLVVFGPFRDLVWVVLLGPATLANASFHIELYFNNRLRAYGRIARAHALRAVANVATSVTGGLLGAGSWGLVSAPLVGLSTGAFVLWWKGEPATGDPARPDILRTYGRFPRYIMPASLLVMAAQQIPVFILAALFSKATAGHYGMAMKVLLLPMSVVGASVSPVFYERFSRTAAGRPLLLRTWAGLAALGLPPMLLVFFFGPELFRFALGPEWAEAGRMAAALTPIALAGFIHSPSSSGLIARGALDVTLAMTVPWVIYRPAALWVGYLVGDLYTGIQIWVVCEIVHLTIFNILLWRRS